MFLARYFIRLSYDGTRYNGWQSQPFDNTITLQTTIEEAMTTLLRSEISIVGCGRTDTGVHAKNYVAHFDFEDIEDTDTLVYRLNKMLPSDIAIHDVFRVKDGAHARFDALSRTYNYRLHTRKSPFKTFSFFYFYGIPDLDILNSAASIILEYEEFYTFAKSHSDVTNYRCAIKECQWKREGNDFVFTITSDRFLRGMVRLITGMCLLVARGKLSLDEVRRALDAQTRLTQSWSVPATGLMMTEIVYEL